MFAPSTPILVAGHRGMVGSAIVRCLQREGFHALILHTRAQTDLCNAAAVDHLFATTRPALVFLAAARVGGILANDTFPADFIRENLLIQTHVIQSAHQHKARRVLFLGSSCIYPRDAPNPIRESALLSGPLEATNRAYALAKIAGIEMCWSYNRQYPRESTRYVAAMPTNLYGPGDNYHPTQSHVIPGLIRRFHEAKLAAHNEVVVWGSGAPRREFMHADDMAKACVQLMMLDEQRWQALTASDRNHGEAPLVNVGTGSDLRIAELATLIARVVGFPGQIRFDPSKPDGTMRKLMSSDKLHALVGQTARPLEEGLAQAYADFLGLAAASTLPVPG